MIRGMLILLILVMIIAFRIEKILCPTVLFCFVWSTVFLLYLINPYGLPKADSEFEKMICGGVLFFLIGAISLGNTEIDGKGVAYRIRSIQWKKTEIIFDIKDDRLIEILLIVSIVIMAGVGSTIIKYLIHGGSLAYVRYNLRYVAFKKGIAGGLMSYVVSPIIFFSIPYMICCQLFGAVKKKTMALFVIAIVFNELLNGGRVELLFILLCLVSAFSIISYKRSLDIKNKIVFLFVSLLIVFLLIKIVSSRGADVIQNVATYLYASINVFEKDVRIFMNGDYRYTYGFLSLQGFIRPIAIVLSSRDISMIENVYRVYRMIDTAVVVGNKRYNSIVTYIGYFFFDFGVAGVLGGSFLFGMISQRIFNRFKEKSCLSLSEACSLQLIFGAIALSFISFSFTGPGYALAVGILALFKLKRKVLRKE